MNNTLGKFEIVEELGKGGFGTVFKAKDTVLERFVALKVLHPYLMEDPVYVARFRREAKTAAGLEHLNIVPIYEVGEVEGRHFIAMRLLQGENLRTVLAERDEPLPVPEALTVLGAIAVALDYAHERGVIHRDVKPSNIFVTSDGAVLTDFGIVRVLSEASAATATGQALGTPEYMAPEQILGRDVSPHTDVYALGVVAYQMLTGDVPFTGTTPFAVQEGHVHRSFAPPQVVNAQLPAAVNAVFERVLAKAPEARYRRSSEFVQALREALTPKPPQPVVPQPNPTGMPQPSQSTSPRLTATAPQTRPSAPTSPIASSATRRPPPGNAQFSPPPQPQKNPAHAAPDKKAVTLGIVSLILGVISCLGSPLILPALLALPAFVLSVIAMIKAKGSANPRAARLWSILGFVIGFIGLLVAGLVFLLRLGLQI